MEHACETQTAHADRLGAARRRRGELRNQRRAAVVAQHQGWFRPNDLAARWNVDRSTLWRWCEAGVLARPQTIGRRAVAWPPEVIAEFETRRAGPAAA
jgi:predicted DNA-binding transcriptional regulator AlpA